MRIAQILAAIVAVAAFAGPLQAKPLVTEQFKSNAAIRLDPTKAYILVRSPGMDLRILRKPTDADRKAYAAERAQAYVKAHAKYLQDVAEYDEEMAVYRQEQNPNLRKPYKPEELTEANFAYKSIDSDNFVTIWQGRVFDKGGPRTTHLIAVPPGTYRIYGQTLGNDNAVVSGFCLCMGSVQFEAAAGMITDMGTIHYPILEARADKVPPAWNGLTPGRGGLTGMRVEPADTSTYVPPALSGMPRVAAAYRASGKMNNYFGLLIDRLTPLPGVLAYRRDEVIDANTNVPVSPE